MSGVDATFPVAADGLDLYSRRNGDELRLIVVGQLTDRSLFSFKVPDLAESSSVNVELLEVAAPTGRLLQASGFTLGLEDPSGGDP
ncbi:MAG: hypothetical protein PVF05_07110 [Gemmatimonadales bacterium]